MQTEKPIEACAELVRNYRMGLSPIVTPDGKKSRELVVFLNSVSDIVSIVNSCHLEPSEVNLIMADQVQNHEAVAALGEDYCIGEIPAKGEKHKMFTFTTSTAFQGVDFMSDNALSVVVSDCKRSHTSIDISCMLPQIAGRQRLKENPFRDIVLFIYNDQNDSSPIDEQLSKVEEKKALTDELTAFLNSSAIPENLKETIRRSIATDNSTNRYRYNYAHYNEETEQFEQNLLPRFNEEYRLRVQYECYKNGLTVYSNLKDQELFSTSEEASPLEPKMQLSRNILKRGFEDLMKLYIDVMEEHKNNPFNLMLENTLMNLREQNQNLATYYHKLGPDRIRALSYREKKLQDALHFSSTNRIITEQLKQAFQTGTTLRAAQWKAELKEIYKKHQIKGNPKMADLENIYGFRMIKHHLTDENGKRYYAYEIKC